MNSGSGIVVAPTGSGKSIIMSEITRRYTNGTVIVVVNEAVVKSQLQNVIPQGVKFFSPTTLLRELSLGTPEADTLILIDEIHHFRRGKAWGRILEQSERCKIVGFTATPVWECDLSLPILCRIPYHLLRRDGWIAPPLTGVMATSEEEVFEALEKDNKHYTVFYISAKEHHKKWMGRLILGDTPLQDRCFKPQDNGRICCIATLTTGWDNKDIDSIVLCRSIGEPHTYLQIIGRLRRGGLVVDMSNNILRFGLDEDIISSRLGHKGHTSASKAVPIMKRCLGCQRLMSPRQTECPYCGWHVPMPHKSGKMWTLMTKEQMEGVEKTLSSYLKQCVRPCPFTPSGAWPVRMWNGETAYISLKTAEYWQTVEKRISALLKSEKVEAVYYIPKTWWILSIGEHGHLMYACDLSYGSNLVWQRI